MPKLSKSLPKYRKHKRSGQAIVNLNGKDFYLGPHGTKASKLEYDRLIGEWLSNERELPGDRAGEVLVKQLLAAYWRHCRSYYVLQDGKASDEQRNIKYALRHVRRRNSSTSGIKLRPTKSNSHSLIRFTWLWGVRLIRRILTRPAKSWGGFPISARLPAAQSFWSITHAKQFHATCDRHCKC